MSIEAKVPLSVAELYLLTDALALGLYRLRFMHGDLTDDLHKKLTAARTELREAIR